MKQSFGTLRQSNCMRCSGRGTRGASFVEAAVTLPFLILFILGLVDLARFFFIYAVLHYAAYVGADFASKIPIETRIDPGACTSAGILQNDCRHFSLHVREILSRASRLAEISGVSPSSRPEGTRFVRFRMYDRTNVFNADQNVSGLQDTAGALIDSMEWDAVFLRPGERAVRISGPNNGTPLDHPTRQLGADPYTNPALTASGWPQPGENWKAVLAQHPIVVKFEAVFDPITPLIPNMMIRAQELGFRRTGEAGVAVPRVTTSSSSTTSSTSTSSSSSSTTSSSVTTSSSTSTTSTSVTSTSTTSTTSSSGTPTTTTSSTSVSTSSTTSTSRTTSSSTSSTRTTTTSSTSTSTTNCDSCRPEWCAIDQDVWEACTPPASNCCTGVPKPGT